MFQFSSARGDHQNMEWEDYDDFQRKYGSGNADCYCKINSMWWTLCNIGRMVLDSMIDKQRVYARAQIITHGTLFWEDGA